MKYRIRWENKNFHDIVTLKCSRIHSCLQTREIVNTLCGNISQATTREKSLNQSFRTLNFFSLSQIRSDSGYESNSNPGDQNHWHRLLNSTFSLNFVAYIFDQHIVAMSVACGCTRIKAFVVNQPLVDSYSLLLEHGAVEFDLCMGGHISQEWYEFTTGDREIDRCGWVYRLVIENVERFGWDYRLLIENNGCYGPKIDWISRLMIAMVEKKIDVSVGF